MLPAWVALPVVALLASTAPPSTVPLTVRPTWRGPAATPPAGLRLRIYPAIPTAEWVPLLETAIEGLRETVLKAPAGEVWVVLDGPDSWSQSRKIQVSAAGSAAVIDLWPGGWLEGSLVAPAGEKPPRDFKARFVPAPGAVGPPAVLQTCGIEESGAFRCKVPATLLDVRLRAEGFVTHYRWGVAVARGKALALGALRLESGASVVGSVVAEDGSTLTTAAKVLLEPAGLASPVEGRDPRAAQLRREAPVNDRGFFHFDGVEPGVYAVTASQPLFGAATATARVLPGLEAELVQPLVLTRPETLSLQVQPPHDPWGDPWRALLYKSDRRLQRGERVREDRLELDGFLRLEGLPRGSYLLSVLGPAGVPWALRPIELGQEPMPVTVEISAVQVEGRVTLAGEPLAAKIWFGGRFGGVQAELESDEEGRYSGLLPRPGEWKVEIAADEPRVRTSLNKIAVQPRPGESVAEVDLELPDTRLVIEVVDEVERPLPGALVSVECIEPGRAPGLAQDRADENGRLTLLGLSAGLHLAQAEVGAGLASAEVSVVLREKTEEPPIRLRVRKLRTLRARVMSGGSPVPGARVLLLPDPTPSPGGSPTLSDARGEVEFRLPPDSRFVLALVQAPGLAFSFGRLPLASQDPLLLPLQAGAGTLRLRAPVPDRATRPVALLRHSGAEIPLLVAQMLNPDAISSGVLGEEIVIPNAEPGAYELCSASAGAGKPTGGCVGGLLVPNGTLELALPSASP